MGGGGTSTNTVTDNTPWASQVPYLEDAMAQSRQQLNTANNAGPYTGNFTAQANPYDASAIQTAMNYTANPGAQLVTQSANNAQTLGGPGVAQNYIGNAQNSAANGIGPQNSALMNTLQNYGTGAQTTQGATPQLSSALNNAAINGANSLQGFTGGLQATAQQAGSDPTQRVMANAQTYANSPQVQAAMTAADAPIMQTLHEQTVPGLNRAAEMGGSLNSSRAGMAEGMANQGAATAIGSTNAAIENAALSQGLNTSAGLYSSGLNAATSANSAGLQGVGSLANTVSGQQTALNLANTNNQLGAANSGLSQGQSFNTADAAAKLAGNTQVGAGLQMGQSAAQASQTQAQQDAAMQAGAGMLQTQGDQAALTDNLQQWNMQNQYAQGLINNYMGNVGANFAPASSATSGQQTNSGPGGAASAVSTVASVAAIAAMFI